MQLYELTVILSEPQAKSISEKLEKTIKEASGVVKDKNEWGKKILAYPIAKNLEGYYIFYQLELEQDRVGGFARLLQNDEGILRHLLVKGTHSTRASTELSRMSSGQAKSEVKVEEKVVEKKEKKEVKSEKKSTRSSRSSSGQAKGAKSKGKK